jgi:hypothetical protein
MVVHVHGQHPFDPTVSKRPMKRRPGGWSSGDGILVLGLGLGLRCTVGWVGL